MNHITDGWAVCSFGDIAEIKNGYAFKSSWFKTSRISESDVPLVKQTQLVNDSVDLSGAVYLDSSFLEAHAEHIIEKGDILIGMSGSIGKVCEYKYDYPALQNQRTGKLCLFAKNFLAPKYLGLYISNIERVLVEKAKGMGVQNISAKDIHGLPFFLPPYKEQHRIVAKIEELFSELDKGIESLKTAREQLKVYRQSLLKHAFEGKLTEQWRKVNADKLETADELLARIQREREMRYQQQLEDWKKAVKECEASGRGSKKPAKPQDFMVPEVIKPFDEYCLRDLPSNWIVVKAKYLCEFITKGTTPAKDDLFDGEGDIPFIKVYNLTKKAILDFTIDPTFVSREIHDGFLARSKVFPNDVLMNIVGPPLGKVSIVPNTFQEWNINQAIAIFRSSELNSKYLAEFLLFERTVSSMMSQSKATAGQFNLTLEICRELPIPVPSKIEQNEITKLIDENFSRIDALEKDIKEQVSLAESLRQSILKKAFSGQLVPQDPNDEPASELLKRIAEEKAQMEATAKATKSATRTPKKQVVSKKKVKA